MTTDLKDKAGSPKHKNKSNKSKEKKFKPPKKISERYLYNSGLAYLQRFPASSSHFRTIMMRKIQKSCRTHDDQDIEECKKLLEDLILKFQDLGFLDDKSYLKGMIISLRRRGLSALQVKIKLQQKGFAPDSIQKALQDHDVQEYETNENGDIYAALVFVRKKRLGPYDPEKKHSLEKSLATMARAGYSYDTATKTLAISVDELEEKLKCLPVR